jgi:hypothetical protein
MFPHTARTASEQEAQQQVSATAPSSRTTRHSLLLSRINISSLQFPCFAANLPLSVSRLRSNFALESSCLAKAKIPLLPLITLAFFCFPCPRLLHAIYSNTQAIVRLLGNRTRSPIWAGPQPRGLETPGGNGLTYAVIPGIDILILSKYVHFRIHNVDRDCVVQIALVERRPRTVALSDRAAAHGANCGVTGWPFDCRLVRISITPGIAKSDVWLSLHLNAVIGVRPSTPDTELEVKEYSGQEGVRAIYRLAGTR